MRAVLLFTVACLAATAYGSTAGTNFHVVFMENYVEAPFDIPLEIHVSNTGSNFASVTVSYPKVGWCSGQTQTVAPGSSVRFNVCFQMRLVKMDGFPTFKTVVVESNNPVSVYAFNKEHYSADGFFAIPTNELSTSYYIGAYDDANIATQFAISATTECDVQAILPDNNGVPVRVNYKGAVYTNGEKFNMRLSQYETFLAQGRGDLTGTRIISSQPIAVFSGNVRNLNDAGSRDHLVAQLTGTGDWGTRFALSPVPRQNNYGDVIRVIGRRINTQFRIIQPDGSSVTRTLSQAGNYYEQLLQGPVVITSTDSSKPLQVIQMVRSQDRPQSSDVADPALFLAVDSSRWLNNYRAPDLEYSRTNSSYNKNFVLLAVTNGQQNNLRIDGGGANPIQPWVIVDGTAIGWVEVLSGSSHRYTHTSNVDFGASIYGASDRESYAFALGADLSGTGCEESLMTLGDGQDNDCDGAVDEEVFNQIDDDGDGLIDEDCRTSSIEAFGNNYAIMFMENNVDDNPNAQSFLEIYLSAVDDQASVEYSLSNEIGTTNRTISPGEVEIFTNLPVSLRHIGSGIDTKTITITAESDVVVYGINKQTWSTDGFLAFPNDVVGTEYYTAHYWPGTDKNEFAVTPVTRNQVTTINVKMPNSRVENGVTINCNAQFGSTTISSGETFTFTLQYGQTAQFQAVSDNDNLNGAYVTSTLPISLFSGNVRARVEPDLKNSRDHLVQQLAPVNTWGREFVTMPIPRVMNRGDIFSVTASQAGTVVIVDIQNADGSSTTQQTINLNNAGDYGNVNIGSTQFGFFQSNLPVQLVQYVKTTDDPNVDNADPAMMLIPPVEQWSRNYRLSTPRTGQEDGSGGFLPFDNFVMITVPTNQRNGLRLDGAGLNLVSPGWIDIASTQQPQYSAATIEVPFGRHTLTHIDDAVYFQALMYGRADRESYALPLGMRLVARGCQTTTMVEGDNVDNDCDGSVDEELCNGVDDDADGASDEDCGSGVASGRNFYVTYMENSVECPKDFDLELYVAVVGSDKATISVLAPLVSFPKYEIMQEVEPGKVRGLGFTSRMRNEGQGVNNNTVFVRASSEVVVYGINKDLFSNDGFLVYPESSLGTDHYTCSYTPATYKTQFAVTAVVDNTQVTITLPSNRANIAVEYNGNTFTQGQTFTVNIDRFQSYQAQSTGDLTGTRVRSNQRVAVFSGNIRSNIALSGSRDHLVEQMIPTSSYGSEFYVVPFPERTVGDILRIIARDSNTQVRIDGNLVTTLSAGQYIQQEISSTTNGVRVTSSNPVTVIQFVKSQDGRNNPETADPAMLVVPATGNFIASATFITPVYSGGNQPGSDYQNFFTIVIVNGQQNNVRLNGNPLTGVSWRSISNSGYLQTTFDVPSGESHTVTTTSGARFYGRLYGKADRESYAFLAGFQF